MYIASLVVGMGHESILGLPGVRYQGPVALHVKLHYRIPAMPVM